LAGKGDRILRADARAVSFAPAKSRPKSKECQRAALNRLLAVARLLRRNKPFNAREAGVMLGHSAKTIKRDLRLLRQHGWKIDWNVYECTYVLRSAPRPTLF
jgi:hypothetical protein